MRLGLGPVDPSAPNLRALAESAVGASFDCIWVDGPLAAAAVVAQWVPIRVGAVVDVGLHHPLHLAEDIAVADIASSGRVEVMLRPANDDPDVVKEHLHVLAAALSGAHIQWEGLHLRVPGRLADNGPVPQRLALNPRPAQPVVPMWLIDLQSEWAATAGQLGFGVALRWRHGLEMGSGRSRLPRVVMCPGTVEPADLLAAAGDQAGYFIVDAATPADVRAAGRRLAGPLRMPEFPDWITSS